MRLPLLTASLLVLAVAAPAPALAAPVKYRGDTAPQDVALDGRTKPEPQPFDITFSASRATAVSFYGTVRCPDGSAINSSVDATFAATVKKGVLALSGADPANFRVAWRVNGTVTPTGATGTAHLEQHQFARDDGPVCGADFNWTAKPGTAFDPPPRGAGALDVTQTLTAVRATKGADEYLAVTGLQCRNHATHVLFKVAGRTKTVKCSARNAVISAALAPHKTYTVDITPLRRRGGRTIRRGAVRRAGFYLPGTEVKWPVIAGLKIPKK
jgi:hypothetical protein